MSRSTRRALLGAGVVLASGALVACGGESERAETSASTTAAASNSSYRSGEQLDETPAIANVTDPERRAYVAKVDSVCRRLDGDREAALESAGEGAEGAETGEGARAYDDSITLGERQLREIKAIPPPPGEAELVRTNVFDILERQLLIRRQMQTALSDQDVPRLEHLRAQLDDLTQSLLGFARGYGFRVCGED